MQNKLQLDDIISKICRLQLGDSIEALDNYLHAYPDEYDITRFQAIKDEYRLMLEYWKSGYSDPQRESIYRQLLHRLYVFACEIRQRAFYRDNDFWRILSQHSRRTHADWSLTDIKTELEQYVADMTLLELEPEHVRQVKAAPLARDHQMMMYDLFDYVITSPSWTEGISSLCTEMLLLPTIESADQQLLLSAIMLSLLQTFDVHKFMTLVHVYQQTDDKAVRQRALVGWALTLDEDKLSLYPEMKTEVTTMCGSQRCRKELAELQIQLFYCMDAEKDQRMIRNEIMPDLMNGSRLQMTDHGLTEMDEDSLEDILHPNAAEHDIDKMEQSVQRMINMQKEGADIYFAGFSQMKRFTFFSNLSNWFVPFSPDHPAIRDIWYHTKGKELLQTITSAGAFCDSDRYSFVLAFEQVLGQLPEGMLKMIKSGEASALPLGGEISDEERQNEAFIRRMYLQNLYRFFRLYPARREFHDPFEHRKNYLLFANAVFKNSALSAHMTEIAAFLIKRHRYDEAILVLFHCDESCYDYQYYMMLGNLLQHHTVHSTQSQEECYRHALSLKPNDRHAMAGLARVFYSQADYQQASDLYNQLVASYPDNKSYMLSAAICLVNLGRHDEAQKYLYKLNYLYPDDWSVVRALAWELVLDAKHESAIKYYEQLMGLETLVADDLIHYGCCLWLSGKLESAISIFRKYLNLNDGDIQKLSDTFRKTEHQLFSQHHITDTEISMMLDAIQM